MFAILKTGGKQYKVEKDAVIKIDKLKGDSGNKVEFNEVLMLGDNGKPLLIGTPLVKNAKVTGEIINQLKEDKIIIFKKKRRKSSRTKNGYRHSVTQVKILNITKD